jgi:hypothetical protein
VTERTPPAGQLEGQQGSDAEPTTAELLERAKQLDELVRAHLTKLGLLGEGEK